MSTLSSCRGRLIPLSLALALVGLAACKPALLPGTEIKETDENRAVYDVVAAYHKAMQDRNPQAVLQLVSRDYFETSGTEDPSDDYGYDQLAQHLTEDLDRTKVLRLDLHLKSIDVKDDHAEVLYRYQSRAHVEFPAGDQWISKTDVNKLKLRREGESWKIISGL